CHARGGHSPVRRLARGSRAARGGTTRAGTGPGRAQLWPRTNGRRASRAAYVGRGGRVTTHVELRRGAYADSVTLLQVSRTVQRLDGVAAAQVAMATALNIEVLTEMGFTVPPEATANDMLVALRMSDDGSVEAALA